MASFEQAFRDNLSLTIFHNRHNIRFVLYKNNTGFTLVIFLQSSTVEPDKENDQEQLISEISDEATTQTVLKKSAPLTTHLDPVRRPCPALWHINIVDQKAVALQFLKELLQNALAFGKSLTFENSAKAGLNDPLIEEDIKIILQCVDKSDYF